MQFEYWTQGRSLRMISPFIQPRRFFQHAYHRKLSWHYSRHCLHLHRGLVLYLLSPLAAAITGQDIQICGGSSLAR